MIKNYLIIGIRNLLRNRLNSVINLLGLALGIACCLLIILYVQHEVSYDDFHVHKNHLFRVSNIMNLGGNEDHYALSSMAVAPGLKDAYPAVEDYVRFLYSSGQTAVKYQDRLFNENAIYLVDPQVFDVFTYPLLQGDPSTALTDPGTIVLTARMADKYFGSEDPLSKMLELNGRPFKITGIMADLPDQTDLPINALLSIKNLPPQAVEGFNQDWGRLAFYTFLKFSDPNAAVEFQPLLDEFAAKNALPFWKENSIEGSIEYRLTALPDLHFRTDMSYDTPKGNLTYLYLFGVVAAFILIVACINYVNLSVAQSSRRGLEVGIRKATGAHRSQLIGQFIGESLLMTLISLGVAIILVELALPVFNELADKHFSFQDVFQLPLLLSMAAIVVFIGIVAGSYPALFLASFKPVEVLKGQLSLSGRHWLSRVLVVVQFVVAVAMISSTLVVYAQMNFLKNQDLGFSTDQIMVIDVPRDTSILRRLPQVKHELLANPGVKGIATTGRSVPGGGTGSLLFRVEDNHELKENHFNVVSVDEDFLDLLEIPLVLGRNFDRSRGTEQQEAFIVNEAFVKEMGWENPIGKRIQWGLEANNQAVNDGKVVGVIGDYHYASLHNKVDPLVWIYNPNNPGKLLVQLNGGSLHAATDFVTLKWQEFDPGHPMEFVFLDSFFDRQYRQEDRLMSLFTYFSLLTIFIACMGLFGLASFITQQRTKEIGIRKTLGAETSSIIYLISKDFAWMVMVAVAIAVPLSYAGIRQWLSGFAYPVDMPWLVFCIAGVLALSIALATTSYHAVRAARSNPVDALRHD